MISASSSPFFLNSKLKTKEAEIYDLKFASAAGSAGGSTMPVKMLPGLRMKEAFQEGTEISEMSGPKQSQSVRHPAGSTAGLGARAQTNTVQPQSSSLQVPLVLQRKEFTGEKLSQEINASPSPTEVFGNATSKENRFLLPCSPHLYDPEIRQILNTTSVFIMFTTFKHLKLRLSLEDLTLLPINQDVEIAAPTAAPSQPRTEVTPTDFSQIVLSATKT